jgi:hypothetical protein
LNESADARRPEPDLSTSERVDLRLQLIAAADDLERLQALLRDACDSLLLCFAGVSDGVRDLCDGADVGGPAQALQAELSGVVVALQFQDLAQQLIAHTRGHLQRCAEDLHFTMPGALRQAGPVTQQAMHAGSVDLF